MTPHCSKISPLRTKQSFDTLIYAIGNMPDVASKQAIEQILMNGEKLINLSYWLLLLPAGALAISTAYFIKRYKSLKSGLTKEGLENAASFMDKVHLDMRKPVEEMDASLGYARIVLNQTIAKELPMKEKVDLINMLEDSSKKHRLANEPLLSDDERLRRMEEYSVSRHRVEEFLYNQEHGRKKNIGVSKKKVKAI